MTLKTLILASIRFFDKIIVAKLYFALSLIDSTIITESLKFSR